MQDFQKRVVQERAELIEKISKLSAFLDGDRFLELPDAERERLLRQNRIMREYAGVLAERIACF